MDLITLGLLYAAYRIGKRGEKPEEPSVGSRALPAAGKPPEFSADQRERLATNVNGQLYFRPIIVALLRERLMRTSLEQVQGPPGVLFFRLIPLADTSAFDGIRLLEQRGGTVLVSLSSILPKGERIVAASFGEMPETFRRSPHFATMEAPPAPPAPKHVNGTNAKPEPSPFPVPEVVEDQAKK